MLFLIAEVASVAVSTVRPGSAEAAPAPAGQGFTVTSGDLKFILKQIKIAEHHAMSQTRTNVCGTLVGSGPDQIPDRLTSYGLRTVDGSCNNLIPGRERFASADQTFPRLTKPTFKDAEGVPAGFLGPGSPAVASSSYTQKKGNVFDSQPRTVSNLVVDQTSTNPAAIAAAAFPVRSQGNPGLHPCTTDPDPLAAPPVAAAPPDCVPSHQTLFIPNVTTDVGLSPPYNSMFTFFGQFFDHGVDQTVKSGGTVFVPLKADDPLIAGPDHIAGNADDLPASQRFMVLTRAQNQPGPDGILGDRPGTPADESADDVQDANNTDSPWVDQSQTYTSHASHQVFLREYRRVPGGPDGIVANDPATRVDESLDNNGPVSTGNLLGGPAGNGASGMATWASVKAQAADMLGLKLVDADVTNVPMIAADPYGRFIPGPARGLAQYVTDTGLVEGNTTTPVPVPANVKHFDTPFLADIAHNADPSPVDTDHNPGTPPVAPTPDDDHVASADFANQPAGTYDDEMLDAHFCAGDGRVNENIALTSIHQIFHSEHDRLVKDITSTLNSDPAALAEWNKQVTQPGPDGILNDDPATTADESADNVDGYNFGERLFQAARFVTEMEYQHLVFEEFARKVQPAVRPFHLYHSDINAAIPAEFAHAVYRFGHSMLDDTVARTTTNADGSKTDNSTPLLNAFLNPPEYFNDGDGSPTTQYTPEQAAGAVIMGSSDQVGNELDEFVTETLRNNLLGLPLDLPTINMARAREAGVPSLNELRRQIFAETNDGQMTPYTDWSDFGQHLKHPESLINFVAAYGKHTSITGATTLAAKRAAAKAIVDPVDPADAPADAADFMFSTGDWASKPTGLDDVDLWVGGLAELTNLGGGLLGSTFNYVFQNTLENLQDGDRLYYLARTPGMNLRTQLEGNSFAEMIQRNTEGTRTLKADAFATADCKFELGAITFPYSAALSAPPAAGDPAPVTGAGSVNDAASTECNENLLLLRKPDGTIQYRSFNKVDPSGINGQSVYKGTAGPDRIFGGIDNDTFWGDEGKDVIEGNNGDDIALGGDGNDIITDLNGADTLKGGPGNDAIDGGPGDDLPMGGDGADFINGGANDNESFAGEGNDFIIAGQGADAVFGDGGDDWIQGGSGQDLLQGDHSAPFFDDPGEVKPGNDVFVGQVGENDYDAEGGDDVMSQNSAVDRNAGAGGWDWAFHQYDTVGADDDMEINNNLLNLPIQVVVNRDRWQETEADSGSKFNDIIKGDDETPATLGGAGFTGCDALDQAGLDRIPGLDPLVPPLNVPAASVAVNAASGVCPLSGNVWGDGNILLGGGGGDTIEGRGGNDIIDGDKALHVRIGIRTDPADPATEIGSTDLMEGKALTGSFGPGTAGMTLQQAVFAGLVDPGNLVMGRRIDAELDTPAALDTAVFSGPQADYDITRNADGSVTVNHARGAATDGIDTLTGIENLRFGGITGTDVPLGPSATLAPGAGVSTAFAAQQIGTSSTARAFTLSNGGLAPLTFTAATRFSLTGTDAASFALGATTCTTTLAPGASCTVQVSFRPVTPAGAKSANLVATNNSGGTAGSTQTVALTGTATAAAPQLAPTGAPAVTPALMVPGVTLTATRGTLADANGLASVSLQWQQTAANGTTFADIPGTPPVTTTTSTFRILPIAPVINNPNRCRSYRIAATVTDGLGKVEARVFSPATPRVIGVPLCTAAAPALAAASVSLSPLARTLEPVVTTTSLAAAAVRVSTSASASASAPLSVSARVPAGANTVAITVFRLNSAVKRTAHARQAPSSVHIATVYRKTTKAKRYVFRLTEKPFRHLKAGRYLVSVRVGPSRTVLGPATNRQITVKRSPTKIAR